MYGSEQVRLCRKYALTAWICLFAWIFAQGAGASQLKAEARLDIEVSVGSTPAPNAAVIAAEEGLQHVASRTTDSSGRASLIVPPGRYRVSASFDGHAAQSAAVNATGGSAVGVHLRLTTPDPFALVPPGSGVVRGRVVGMNGEPVPHAWVNLEPAHGQGGTGRTENDGTFRFTARARPPRFPYTKLIVSEAIQPWSDVPARVFLPDRTELNHSVEVREKQETSGLELRVSTSPRYRVTVRLRDDLGSVFYNPSLAFRAGTWSGGARVTPQHTAALGPFAPGRVAVSACADGLNGIRLAGEIHVDIVDGPVDDVVIRLIPVGRMGNVSNSQGVRQDCAARR